MSVPATRGGEGRGTAETEAYSSMSVNLHSQSLVFHDQVDADVTPTARFELPSDQDGFLKWHVCIVRPQICCARN